MRREQIHKLVLNHAVNADFVFSNMKNNPKSIMYACLNFAESQEGQLEQLAVRFPKVEVANAFAAKLTECVNSCRKRETEE